VSKKKRQPPADPDPLSEMLHGMWEALAAGDVLRAEVETARCCFIPHRLGVSQDEADAIFIGMAKQGGRPEDAALLRLIMLMGSPAVKDQARVALGELTGKGIYPASWVAEAGKAEPVQAWRSYDVYGDWEDILVTFRYASGEHTLVARIGLTNLPQVSRLTLIDGKPSLDKEGPFDEVEEISLADVRTRLEPALAAAESSEWLSADTGALIPVAKSRLRRLPAGEQKKDERVRTSEERAALVREFLSSPQAAEAVTADEASTRFWAEILTAWGSRAPGHQPLQAGPATLRYLLNDYAPYTYPVTAEQREHMDHAVTAWARWSAAQRGLDEEHILDRLPQTLSDFRFFYDVDTSAERRAYLADVATSDADLAALKDAWLTRTIAIPPSDERETEAAETKNLDVTDPADRARYLAADFAECTLRDGMSREDLTGVLSQVADELWDAEMTGTRKHALALLAEGALGRHDIMHALVRQVLADRSGRAPGAGA
jgi:hypothetical protein